MYLTALRITNFRNFREQRLEIPPGGVAIIGDNGQGKTNFLEAIYYLEIFRSFRGAPDDQLVRFGESVFRVEGSVEVDGRSRSIAAAYDRKRRKKKVTVDSVEVERLGDALGRLGAVIFSPSDVTLISGAPSTRRRFLDIVLSLAEPRYLENLQRYRQALSQRNALLRKGEPAALVAAWNDGLVRFGSRVSAARQHWVADHAAAFAERAAAIAGGSPAALEYEPSIPLDPSNGPLDADGIAAAFSEALERQEARERRYGTTLVGPHRDDLRIRASPTAGADLVDLRTYGSGGQQRTAAIALRMVEGETLRERLGSDPVILLDDVFAELDEGRSRRILEWIEAERLAQVILTAPKAADVELRGGSLTSWSIHSGTLSPL